VENFNKNLENNTRDVEKGASFDKTTKKRMQMHPLFLYSSCYGTVKIT